MALDNDEELFVKKLYADSQKEKKAKDDEVIMWADVENIMKRKDINEGEKARLRYERKVQYYDSLETNL